MTNFAEWLNLQEKATPIPKLPNRPAAKGFKPAQTLRSKQMAFGPSAYYREPMGPLNRAAFMALSGIGSNFRDAMYRQGSGAEPPAPGALPWPDPAEDEHSVTVTGTALLKGDENVDHNDKITAARDEILHITMPAYFANELKDENGQHTPNWVDKNVYKSFDIHNPKILRSGLTDDGSTLWLSIQYSKFTTTDRLQARHYGPYHQGGEQHGPAVTSRNPPSWRH